MRLCKHCKHYDPPTINSKTSIPDACRARLPGVDPEFDPVTGREDMQNHVPRIMRRDGQPCGPAAVLFEQRVPLFKRLLHL